MKKEKIKVDVTLEDIDDYLNKNSIIKENWEKGKIVEWLDNSNFADFIMGLYAVWRRQGDVLDRATLEILLPYLSRGIIYDYMGRAVKTKIAKGVSIGRGLKAISPLYNSNNQLEIIQYVRKAFTMARHKEIDIRKAMPKRNN
jgi:hypothetical protein